MDEKSNLEGVAESYRTAAGLPEEPVHVDDVGEVEPKHRNTVTDEEWVERNAANSTPGNEPDKDGDEEEPAPKTAAKKSAAKKK